MVLTPAALETFRQALRARPASVAELRDLVPLGDDEFAAALQELTGAGCLSIDSQQRLGVVSPSQAIGDVVGQRIAEHQEQVRSALEQARDDLRVLQSLARDWAIGGTPGEVLPATFVHGPMAGRDAAQLLFERRGPVPSLAVLPDVRSLEKPPPEVLEPFLAMLRQKPDPTGSCSARTTAPTPTSPRPWSSSATRGPSSAPTRPCPAGSPSTPTTPSCSPRTGARAGRPTCSS